MTMHRMVLFSKDEQLAGEACSLLSGATNGGEVIVPVRGLAGGRFCVIRDPSGATAALYQA